jgi:hypothetical protein
VKYLIRLLAGLSFVSASHAQMQEGFEGQWIREHYAWDGDTGKFRVHEGELQLWDAEKGKASIFLYGVPWGENTWSFTTRNEYAGTTANYLCVYLRSLSTDEDGEAVFVRLGYTKQNVSLCRRQTTGKVDVLIEGRDLLAEPQEVEIRVTATDNEHFTLYSRTPTETLFVEEGDTTLTLSGKDTGYFMVTATYSTKHGQDKFIDNISIARFGEEETPDVPETPSNPEEPGIIGVSPNAGMLIISEVMADFNGLTELPQTEYVELHNTSKETLRLANCAFSYDGKRTALNDGLLTAGGYLVLYRSEREVTIDEGGVGQGLAKFPAQLSNDGKPLALLNAEGNVIDSVQYRKAKAGKSWEREGNWWYLSTDSRGGTPGSANSVPDGEKVPILPSISEDPPADPPSPPGTEPEDEPKDEPEDPLSPDEPKIIGVSPEKGILIINEVMADPTGLTELPQTEYVELHNTSEETLTLEGCVFSYNGSRTALDDELLSAGGYLVLYRSEQDITIDEGGIGQGLAKFPFRLANEGKTLTLLNAEGNVIDSVQYLKAKPGQSWEREGDWWYISTDHRGGTPGSANSTPKGEKVPVLPSLQDNPEDPSSDPSSPSETEPEEGKSSILPPHYDKLSGAYDISYALDRSGYKCRAIVYDVSGRQRTVLPISNLWGAQGKLTWDGCDEDGERLPKGLYLFYAELYHEDGFVCRFKQAFLVH